MAPAPMKRTSLRQTAVTKLARSPCIGVIAVMIGTAPAQAIGCPAAWPRRRKCRPDGRRPPAPAKRRMCSRSPPPRRSGRSLHASTASRIAARDGQARRCHRAIDHRQQAFDALRDCRARMSAPTLQHFGGRHAFGIGKVGMRHQRAAQRDGEQHAQHAARRTDEKGGPERKARPPAHDHQAGQHEDDRRPCAPAAEQTVCTMLFSRMLEPGKRPSNAIEITAAGIEVAKVRPTFNPR